MRKRSALFLGVVATGMVGGAMLALRQSTPAPLEAWALVGGHVSATTDETAARKPAPQIASTLTPSLTGQAQSTPAGGGDGLPALEVATLPTPVTVPEIAVKSDALSNEDLECTLDHFGRRGAMPLDRLVAVMKSQLGGMQATASGDIVRAVVQADLNRSGDGPRIKTAAVDLLRAAYPAGTVVGAALAQPFDLNDAPPETAPGYDPCGNPAAIGGSPYPFANVFFTINPVPVIASRLSASTEGGT